MRSLLLAFALALTSLKRNLFRVSLTVLGVVIAVTALMIVSAIGAGADEDLAREFAAVGENMLQMLPEAVGTRAERTLTEADARAITTVPGVLFVAPMIQTLQYANGELYSGSTTVLGVTRSYFDIRNIRLDVGEIWPETDEHTSARVCVLGTTARDKFFRTANPIGLSLRIGRDTYRVIGIGAERGLSPIGFDYDDVVYIPLGTARAHLLPFKNMGVTTIYFRAQSAAAVPAVFAGTMALMRQRHAIQPSEVEDFRIANFTSLVQGHAKAHDLMSNLLLAVAAISLVVGGIGVMNVMLVNITERKREIGICLAIGAGPPDIALQFLVEAMTLTLSGGIIGIAVGFVASVLTANALGMSASFHLRTILVGIFASLAVGLTFGFLPALRAARLEPIVALRRD